jgi:hypothetical protein
MTLVIDSASSPSSCFTSPLGHTSMTSSSNTSRIGAPAKAAIRCSTETTSSRGASASSELTIPNPYVAPTARTLS